MSGIGNLNLKIAVLDRDYYALQAINSYLAWDRRTRVTLMANNLKELWDHLRETAEAELPDVVVIDADHMQYPETLDNVIGRIRGRIPHVMVFCLAQEVEPDLVETAAESGAQAFMLKQEVRLQIAWAIVYALERDFTVTAGVANACRGTRSSRIFNAAVLPAQREYPEMTERVRQAIQLCVIEGMPAHLAADEMGISLHTIRGYVKEGYRILESYDNEDYPTDMTPQERAFMRFTALADPDE